MNDRRIHARCDGYMVVRYERAGKWYVEPNRPDRKRERVGIIEAARRAVHAEVLGGTITTGLPGGSTFDRWVSGLRAGVVA